MIKLIAVLMLVFATSDVQYYPLKRGNEIPYCQLTWKDFKVKQVVEGITVAESATSIGYRYDGDSKVQVFCTFNTEESFVIKKGITDYVLNHEQRHFDITYIFAQKFIERLSKEKTYSVEIIDAIYAKILSEKDAMQTQYDKETSNAQNAAMQQVWNEKIEKLLP